MVSILAIDFSKNSTGLAFGLPGELPTLSTKSFAKWEGATLDECAASIIQWLPEAIAVFRPGLIVIEAALPPAASRDQISARLALGADFMIKGAAKIKQIRCMEVHAGTWKSFFLGSGNLPSKQSKARAMEICRRIGLAPKNNDEADAAGLWFYACSAFAKVNDDRLLPLLARARVQVAA